MSDYFPDFSVCAKYCNKFSKTICVGCPYTILHAFDSHTKVSPTLEWKPRRWGKTNAIGKLMVKLSSFGYPIYYITQTYSMVRYNLYNANFKYLNDNGILKPLTMYEVQRGISASGKGLLVLDEINHWDFDKYCRKGIPSYIQIVKGYYTK